jgi:hypothetical protein
VQTNVMIALRAWTPTDHHRRLEELLRNAYGALAPHLRHQHVILLWKWLSRSGEMVVERDMEHNGRLGISKYALPMASSGKETIGKRAGSIRTPDDKECLPHHRSLLPCIIRMDRH